MNTLITVCFSAAALLLASGTPIVRDEEACGGNGPRELNATQPTVFRSANWPNGTYEPDSLCEWVIRQNEDLVLELQFLNFTLESSENCKSDYVEVYDGEDDSAELVGRYCGQSAPDSIIASGSALFVRFASDASVQYQGFLARIGEPYDSSACTTSRPQEVTQDLGTFLTVNYPADYPVNARCEWRFQAEEGETWTVRFADFETEECCDCDFLDIFDGPATFFPRLGRWFGANTLPPAISSSGSGMYMRFLADFSIQRKGFIGAYQKNPAEES